jgi:hypothetical protein
MDGIGAPTYEDLLETAHELGRDDGRFAAAFEAPGPVDAAAACCLGRTPAEFARLLWGRPGSPPAGLEANAPLWYATGFAEGLAPSAQPTHVAAFVGRGRRALT